MPVKKFLALLGKKNKKLPLSLLFALLMMIKSFCIEFSEMAFLQSYVSTVLICKRDGIFNAIALFEIWI